MNMHDLGMPLVAPTALALMIDLGMPLAALALASC